MAEILSAQSVDKPKPRGHNPKHGVARAEIAEALGTSETATRKAEQHVETAEAFPFMQGEDWREARAPRVSSRSCSPRDCQTAPPFDKLVKDDDPLAYIASVNLKRRHLTKGQQAMAMAMMYPEPEKGGRNKNEAVRKTVVSTGFSVERLKQARAVLRHSRSVAESVLKGITPLDAALATVKEEEQYQQSDEAKLTRLQQSAPDLAEQVNEGDARQRVWLPPRCSPPLSPTGNASEHPRRA